MVRKAIGIDLGGTNIKAGVVDERGKVLSRVSIPTLSTGGHGVVVQRIAQAAFQAREAAGTPWRDISAVGLGSPGSFEGPRGIVHHSPNMKDMEGKELRRPLLKALGQPGLTVVLENDANVAAYAEAWMGVGRRTKNLVLFTLGTGVGGGIVLNGDIWRGAWGTAAELGHMMLFPDGALCGCGNHGCLEAYCSATALVRRFYEAFTAGKRTRLARLAREGEVTARDIDKAAKEGDRLCLALMAETGRWLGIGVSNVLHTLNVEMVVFTGGMTAAGDLLLRPICEEARKLTFPLAFRGVKILFSHMGNDAGLIGAAGWALKQAGQEKGGNA